ncbi:hypothetical protein PG985_011316 [Apiospora marii]|uniref:uncharacterized protein n=1 Tax=Apiospora marii TaxID=335849 RepID=UPI00313040B7
MTQVENIDSFEEGLKSGYASDVKVVCGDRTWNLHKVILSTRSTFFRKAFTGDSKEAHGDHLTLPDHKPHEVQGIITFIYTGRLCSNLEKDESLETYIRIFELGDTFGLGALRTYAANKIEEVLVRIALVINKVAIDPFLTISPEAFDSFSRIARFSYSTSSETFAPLRKNMLGFFTSTGMNALQLGQFNELFSKIPGMATHVSTALADKASPIGEVLHALSDSLEQLRRTLENISVS